MDPKTLSANTLLKAEVLKTGVVKILTPGAKERTVTFPSFQKLIMNGAQVEDNSEVAEDHDVTFIPPSNCIYMGNHEDKKSGAKKMNIICHYPEKKGVVEHHGNKYEIPIPHVLIKYTVTRSPKEHGVWTLDTRTIRWFTALSGNSITYVHKGYQGCTVGSGAQLDPLVMPNMYNDARMCTGSNSIPTRYMDNNLLGLNFLYDIIEGSPFNDDLSLVGMDRSKADRIYKGSDSPFKNIKLGRSGERGNSGFTPESWLKFLSCFETFPYDVCNNWSMSGSGAIGRPKDEYLKK